MNTYGHVIKFERMRQNIKQVELAKGICSPAYLSKIESNSIVPSEDILESLFTNLGLSIPSPDSISEAEFLQKVQLIYYEALMKKDRIKIKVQLTEISKELFVFSNHEKYFTYLLILIRLKMLVQDTKYDTYSFISAASSLSKDFNAHQLFMLNSCIGYFHYYKNEFTFALAKFEKALEFHNLITVQECETADFYYGISTMYLQNQKIMETLEYIDKSLFYFNKEFLFFRAIESNIIKAVAYKRAGQLEQAHENLFIAEKISVDHNSTGNLSMIFLNIASVYSMQGNIQLSIEYYHKSIKLGNDLQSKIISIYCLVLENSKIKCSEEVIKWSNNGIRLYEENPLEGLKGMYFHFQCHISKHTGFKNFELIVSDTISHFLSVQDYRNANKYGLLLANYFLKEKQYKKATGCFSLANDYLSKKENCKFIEDI